jgi:hypothetical protein
MLTGLGSNYESLITSITSRDDPVSLSSFYAYLLSAELCIKRNNSAREIHSSTNAASRSYNSGRVDGQQGHD